MRTAAIAFALLCLFVLADAGHADVPRTMSYQGVLTDSLGQRVPDGAYLVSFKLYDTATGGYPSWTEDLTVFTDDGIFSTVLGNTNPVQVNFNVQRWLGISVEGEPELYPRTQLAGVPYAHRAVWADSLAGGGGGGDDDWFFDGEGNIYRLSGGVGIMTSDPVTPLHVRHNTESAATFEIGSPTVAAPSTATALYAAVSDTANAGHFVATGDGIGLIANSYGYGNAFHAASLGSGNAVNAFAVGSGYAGYFQGGAGVRVDGLARVNSFQMSPGASAGYVLTSDGSGVGTWQVPPTGGEADADWMISGANMYSLVSGNVGIGTMTPVAPFQVVSGDTAAIWATVGSPPYSPSLNGTAVYAAADGFKSAGTFAQSGSGVAVHAHATGSGIPVYAVAEGPSPAVYARAQGGDWAGKFEGGKGVWTDGGIASLGDVGIGTEAPSARLHVVQDSMEYSGYFSGGRGIFVEDGLRMIDGLVDIGVNPLIGGKFNVDGGGLTAASFISDSDLAGASTLVATASGTGRSARFSGGSGVYVEDVLEVSSDGDRAGVFTAGGVLGHTVHAEASGADGIAVYGESLPSDQDGTGGKFKGGQTGALGVATHTGDGWVYGIEGEANGGTGYNVGVSGIAYDGEYGYGIRGTAINAASAGYAGYFTGDVHITGTLTGGGVAAAQIDHPLDPSGMYLTQPYVTSVEMTTVINGNITLDGSGEAWVELPEWYEGITGDHRYQLTPIGAGAPNLHVAERIADGRFMIAGGTPGLDVSWQVTGVRRDRYAEEHRIRVEAPKTGDEFGRYAHPELYGAPMEEAIGFIGIDVRPRD